MKVRLIWIAIIICSYYHLAYGEDIAKALAKSAAVLAREGKYDEAILLYEKAYSIDPAPVLLFNIARILEKKGDFIRAKEVYEKYLGLERGQEGRKSARERLEFVLDQIPGTISISVEPKTARVILDGKVINSDVKIEVKRGKHIIEAHAEGMKDETREIEIVPMEHKEIFIKLEPLPIEIDIICDMSQGLVKVDDNVVGACPIKGVKILPGEHRFKLVKDGKNLLEKKMVLTQGSEISLMVGKDKIFPINKTLQWLTIGSGVAILAGAGILTYVAERQRAQVVEAKKDSYGVIIGMTQTRARDLETSANRKAIAAGILYGVGSAMVCTGVLLFLTLSR